eukprot:UN24893
MRTKMMIYSKLFVPKIQNETNLRSLKHFHFLKNIWNHPKNILFNVNFTGQRANYFSSTGKKIPIGIFASKLNVLSCFSKCKKVPILDRGSRNPREILQKYFSIYGRPAKFFRLCTLKNEFVIDPRTPREIVSLKK